MTTATLAQDSSFAACVQDLVRRDLAGKEVFQRAVRDLIVAEKPEFEPLASLHMAHQIALAQTRADKFAYLLRHDPARIETGKGLAKFRNFDWSKADDAALARQDAEAGALLARVAELRKKNDGHRGWPKLREFMRAELPPNPAFRALMARITKNDRAVRKGLKECHRGGEGGASPRRSTSPWGSGFPRSDAGTWGRLVSPQARDESGPKPAGSFTIPLISELICSQSFVNP